MVTISGNNMYITKGDTVSIRVTMRDPDGTPHTMVSGDKVVLSIKESAASNAQVILTKNYTAGTDTTYIPVLLTSTETKAIAVGQYSCDIKFKDGTTNSWYTIFPKHSPTQDTRKMTGVDTSWKNFWIMPSIGNNT